MAYPRDRSSRHAEHEAIGRRSHPATRRCAGRPVRLGSRWSFLLLLVLASPVCAQSGINLSWDDCGTAGSSAKTFACDTNEGSQVLIASFAAPTDLEQLVAVLAVLDLQTSGATLPAWWQFKNAGTCRQTALSASANFTSGPSGCPDPWGEAAAAGVARYQAGFGGPNRARIVAGAELPGWCIPIPGETEYLAFKLILSNVQSVGTDACDGCTDGACIVLNSMYVSQCNPPDFDLITPLDRNFVTWQGGIPNCPGATAVQNRTWGAVKTLYR